MIQSRLASRVSRRLWSGGWTGSFGAARIPNLELSRDLGAGRDHHVWRRKAATNIINRALESTVANLLCTDGNLPPAVGKGRKRPPLKRHFDRQQVLPADCCFSEFSLRTLHPPSSGMIQARTRRNAVSLAFVSGDGPSSKLGGAMSYRRCFQFVTASSKDHTINENFCSDICVFSVRCLIQQMSAYCRP